MEEPVYVGQSQLLHYWPRVMVAAAIVPILFGQLIGTLVFLGPALLVALVVPWRFAVLDRGIALWFGFGKFRYLAKENVTVRVGHGSTVLLPRRADRLGYPLTDGVLEHRRLALARGAHRARLPGGGLTQAVGSAARIAARSSRLPASNGTAPSPGNTSVKRSTPNRPAVTSDMLICSTGNWAIT